MIYAVGLLVLLLVGLYGVLLGRGYVELPHKLSDRGWVTAVGFFLMFLSADIGISWSYSGAPTPLTALNKTFTHALAKGMTKIIPMRLSLPMKIDDTLWLQQVSSRENFLIYTMMIYSGRETYYQIAGNIRADLLKDGCNRDEYRTMMKYGLALEFDLYSPAGWATDPIILSPQYCGL